MILGLRPTRGAAMNLCERWVLPPLLDLSMRQRQIEKYRRNLIPAARGRVLEVGVGSRLNLPHYGADVTTIVGLDPSGQLLSMARRRAGRANAPVDLMQGSATEIPLGDDSVDTLVMTWTLCSIPDPLAALSEMGRAPKPGGVLPLSSGEGPGVRGPDGSVEGQAQCSANAGEYGINVFADLGVGEAREADAQAFENLRPPCVVVGEPFLLLAIELDDQLCRVAVEVGDVSVDRNLPPEFRAVKVRAAQLLRP